jgi:hypothetical protein
MQNWEKCKKCIYPKENSKIWVIKIEIKFENLVKGNYNVHIIMGGHNGLMTAVMTIRSL